MSNVNRVVLLTEIIAPYRIPVFNALARHAGLDLHVVFLAETDETLREWRVYKDEIHFSYEILPSWRWRTRRNSFLIHRGLWPGLNKAKPDVIICGGYSYVASWEGLVWAHLHQVEFVLWSESTRDDARAKWRLVEWLKAWFVHHCDRFVVPGKASFEYLGLLGSQSSLISVAPNAVDNAWFAAQGAIAKSQAAELRQELDLPDRFILFVGRLVPEKGVFDLLTAYAKLESSLRSEVGLVFAGDGVCRDELRRQAERITLGTVRFTGFAQREDLAPIYAMAELLVLPTHSDPWGLVVNEAMACGLPIIVTSVAGCSPDLVQDGWNGFIVPPRDNAKLCEALRSILQSPELRRQMGTCSLERIQNFSPEACASGLAAAAIPRSPEAQ
jgi:glycosyltransferase involved in cell wall biosynthesis